MNSTGIGVGNSAFDLLSGSLPAAAGEASAPDGTAFAVVLGAAMQGSAPPAEPPDPTAASIDLASFLGGAAAKPEASSDQDRPRPAAAAPGPTSPIPSWATPSQPPSEVTAPVAGANPAAVPFPPAQRVVGTGVATPANALVVDRATSASNRPAAAPMAESTGPNGPIRGPRPTVYLGAVTLAGVLRPLAREFALYQSVRTRGTPAASNERTDGTDAAGGQMQGAEVVTAGAMLSMMATEPIAADHGKPAAVVDGAATDAGGRLAADPLAEIAVNPKAGPGVDPAGESPSRDGSKKSTAARTAALVATRGRTIAPEATVAVPTPGPSADPESRRLLGAAGGRAVADVGVRDQAGPAPGPGPVAARDTSQPPAGAPNPPVRIDGARVVAAHAPAERVRPTEKQDGSDPASARDQSPTERERGSETRTDRAALSDRFLVVAPDDHGPAAVTTVGPSVTRPLTSTAVDPPPVQAGSATAEPQVRAPVRRSDVVLQLTDDQGDHGRIRVAIRGQTVRATILPSDGALATRLTSEVAALERSLNDRGFDEARVTVQAPRPAPDSAPIWSQASRDARMTVGDTKAQAGSRAQDEPAHDPRGGERREDPRAQDHRGQRGQRARHQKERDQQP